MESSQSIDRARAGWWAMGTVLAAVLGFILYQFIGTFVFGIFLYYATRPVYKRVRRRVRSRSLAAAISVLALALPALFLLAYTLAIALQEFSKFVATQGIDVGRLEAYLSPYIDVSGIVQDPQSLLSQPDSIDAILGLFAGLNQYLGFLGSVALHAFIMVTIAFYLLRDDHRLSSWFLRRFADGDGIVEVYGRRVDHDFSNIFFGNILNAVITGIIGSIAYSLLDFVAPFGLNIPYPALMGVLTGIASLIPVVGMKLVYVPITGWLGFRVFELGGTDLVWFPVLFVLVSFVVVDVFPDLVLRPYVSGRGIHLGMIMLAYIFGPLLFGWYGIFLGPMLLVLVVHFVNLVLPELVSGQPIEPEELGDVITTAGEHPADAEVLDRLETEVDAESAGGDDAASTDVASADSERDAGAGDGANADSDAASGGGEDSESDAAGGGSGSTSGSPSGE